MKLNVALLIAILSLVGCTTSHRVTEQGNEGSQSYSDFNTKMRAESATITLRNGLDLEVFGMNVVGDSVEMRESDSKRVFRIHNDSIENVITRSHFWGGLEGYFLGVG